MLVETMVSEATSAIQRERAPRAQPERRPMEA